MIGLSLPDGPLEVLCLGAHPDDIEIGCGGTLLSLATAHPLRVTFMIMTAATPERRAEAIASAAEFFPDVDVDVRFGELPDGRLPGHWDRAKLLLNEIRTTIRPQLIFAPRNDDAHQDHRLIGELVPTVWRDSLALHYEIPKWDGDLGRVSHYVALSEEIAARKVALLEKCFPSQAGRDWWNGETFLSLMRLRGIECRTKYAEGFHANKVLIAL
jgi:LmbE family N-acetylglucosaminyl deacetylase